MIRQHPATRARTSCTSPFESWAASSVPCSAATTIIGHETILSGRSSAPFAQGRIGSGLSWQTGEPHRKVGIDHLKLAPGERQISSKHGKIVDMRPLRRDHGAGLQRQEIAYAKIADRNTDVQLHGQLCDVSLDAKRSLYRRLLLGRDKSDTSLPFRTRRLSWANEIARLVVTVVLPSPGLALVNSTVL